MTSVRRDAAAVWIVVSALCVTAGWLLSGLRVLSGTGYGVALGVCLMVWWFARRRNERLQVVLRARWRWRRYRRPAPLLFLIASGFAVAGGFVYAPNNYDALTYRVPRLLHWLAEGHWHWIATPNARMNYSGTGAEWLLAPLLAWTRSDRLLVIPSLVSFMLLPGLLFRVLRCTGVRRRVAWQWMWLLPLGLGYALQAGSTGNDLIPATYAIASIHFALRARETGAVRPFILAMIAVGLVTGVKASNLPLALPAVLLLLPVSVRVLKRAPAGIMAGSLVALAVSFVPMGVLNELNAGHWGGDPRNADQLQLTSPLAGLAGNTLLAVTQNLAPPVLPSPTTIEAVVRLLLPAPLLSWIKEGFPRLSLRIAELPQEEAAGLGAGITLLLLAGAAARWCVRKPASQVPAGRRERRLITLAGSVALLVFMSRMGSEATARLLLPYYALFVPCLLAAPANELLVRTRAWRTTALLCSAVALFAMIVTPSRPLFPAVTLLGRLANQSPETPLWKRAETVYRVYAQRFDMLASLRPHLPADAREIAVAFGVDDSEISLWRPFGTRRVRHVTLEEVTRQRPAGFEWLVTKANLVPGGSAALESWAAGVGGKVVGREAIVSRVSTGPQEWLVVQFPRR